MKFKTQNSTKVQKPQKSQNGTKVQNSKPAKRWVPYADMGFQNIAAVSPYPVRCYIATKEDDEEDIITIRDKEGNITRVSDVKFAMMGGALRVLRYAE